MDMTDVSATVLYAIIKYAAYAAWCYLGLRRFSPPATVARALRFGALRWLLGLGFGVAAAIALGSVSAQSVLALYIGVYVPLRVVEWSLMAVWMAPGEAASTLRRRATWLWIAGGIAVSFASDLASPEGMAGRFCVGRCLC